MSHYQYVTLTVLAFCLGGGLVLLTWAQHARDEQRRRERLVRLLIDTRNWLSNSGALMLDRPAYDLRKRIDSTLLAEIGEEAIEQAST